MQRHSKYLGIVARPDLQAHQWAEVFAKATTRVVDTRLHGQLLFAMCLCSCYATPRFLCKARFAVWVYNDNVQRLVSPPWQSLFSNLMIHLSALRFQMEARDLRVDAMVAMCSVVRHIDSVQGAWQAISRVTGGLATRRAPS